MAPTPWLRVELVQPITTVGGATSTSSGASVSDATSGEIERVTTGGATQFTTGASQVYGLSPGPDGIAFDYPSGYGDQPDRGPATLYPVPVPSGASLVPSEISYNTTSEVVYIGGYVANGPNCTNGVDGIPAGGTTATSAFLGTMYSTPCGASLLTLDSTGSSVWFSEGTTKKFLAHASTSSSKTVDEQLPSVASNATPGDVAAGPNGDVYFSLCNVTDTHPGGGAYLVRVNASSSNQTVFSTYSACANTRDSMVYDANDGRIWIANGTNTLTAVRTTDGAVSTYALPSPGGATSGFDAITVDPSRTIWAFRNGDAFAHAYQDDIIGADPSYAYEPHGQAVSVKITELQYSGAFTASIVSGSSASCTVTPVAGGGVQNTFSVTSPPGTACTVAFTDSNANATVYVPVVTQTGTNIPPHPQPEP